MTFRQWLQQQWYAHCLEIEDWPGRLPSYPLQEYFAKYKHWLRREYRHQQNANR